MPVLESIFNKVAGLQACNFIKKRLQHRCFPVHIVKFLRTSILKNICEMRCHISLFILQCKSIDAFYMRYFARFAKPATKSYTGNEKCDISRFIYSQRRFDCFLQSLSSSLIKSLQFQFLDRF